MIKLTKKHNKKIANYSVIVMAIFCMALSLGLLLRNMSWMNGSFFMFGVMFFMGYSLLTLVLKRMRKGVRVNV